MSSKWRLSLSSVKANIDAVAEYRPDDGTNSGPRVACFAVVDVPVILWLGNSTAPFLAVGCIDAASDVVSSSLKASLTEGVGGGVAVDAPEVVKYSVMSGKISSSSGKGINLPCLEHERMYWLVYIVTRENTQNINKQKKKKSSFPPFVVLHMV